MAWLVCPPLGPVRARGRRLDLAGPRACPADVLVRSGASVRRRPAPRHRDWGWSGLAGACTRVGRRQLRRFGADERADAHDPDSVRPRGQPHPPRVDQCRPECQRRRRHGGRNDRPERHARVRRALRAPRRARRLERSGLPRSARLPARARAASACSSACTCACAGARSCSTGRRACTRAAGRRACAGNATDRAARPGAGSRDALACRVACAGCGPGGRDACGTGRTSRCACCRDARAAAELPAGGARGVARAGPGDRNREPDSYRAFSVASCTRAGAARVEHEASGGRISVRAAGATSVPPARPLERPRRDDRASSAVGAAVTATLVAPRPSHGFVRPLPLGLAGALLVAVVVAVLRMGRRRRPPAVVRLRAVSSLDGGRLAA